MKYIYIMSILILVFFNCQKGQPPEHLPIDHNDTTQTPIDTPIIEFGKGTALKNGAIWDAPFEAFLYQCDSLFQVWVEITYPNLRGEHMFITDIPCKEGKYPIENWMYIFPRNQIPECTFRITQDFDQGIGSFSTDTTRNDHFIEIIRYDSIEKIVEGRFQVFLKKSPSNTQWPNVPDSIFLTEGKFHLKIQDP